VDTLSGACYSLRASITKVSRTGVYLLAPQSLAVYTDQYTSQMNGGPARQAQAPSYAFSYGSQQGSYYQPQQGYAAPLNQGFTQRPPMTDVEPPAFYAQPKPQDAQMPAFTAQASAQGYSPDEIRAL